MSTAPTSPDTERQGSDYFFRAFRRHLGLVVALVVAALAAAGVYSFTVAKVYKAEADLLVTPFTDDSALAGVDIFRDPNNSVFAAGRVVTTPAVTKKVIDRLGLHVELRDLLEKVDVKPIQQGNLVAVEAEAGDSASAVRLADAFAQATVDVRNDRFQRGVERGVRLLEDRLKVASAGEKQVLNEQIVLLRSFGGKDPTLTIFSAAIPPEGPSAPRPVLSLVIALLASLILATVAIFAIEFLNPRLLSEDEVVARGPILASVPWAPREVVRRYLHGGEGLPSEFWEAYRTLRASLVGDTGGGRPGRSVVITSAIQGEGKTMTAVNLAAAFTAGGFRVILVDGDLRRPMIAEAFGLSGGESGLAALLEGEAAPADVLVDAPGFDARFRLLLPGPERPVDLLEPVRVEVLLDELKGEADVVVVDSSPLTEFADTFAFAEAADVVLVVVRLGHSRRDKLAELNRFLTQHRIIPSGFVVTGARRFHPSIRRRRRAGQAVPEKETAETQRIRPVPDSVER